jgi:uncharacterized membrane protein YphA (DoxX/SURF4 family)
MSASFLLAVGLTRKRWIEFLAGGQRLIRDPAWVLIVHNAAAAAYAQLGAGLLLIPGLVTPMASLALVGAMAVATSQLIGRGEPFVSLHGRAWWQRPLQGASRRANIEQSQFVKIPAISRITAYDTGFPSLSIR